MLPTFLGLPERGSKPRVVGLTHVLDKGASAAATESVLATAAPHIDIWKFGWGTAYLDPALSAKLALLTAADVRACLGGTLLEIAWSQGKDRECLAWAHDVGFACVEVSRGVATMPLTDKHELIRRAAERFVVLSEVGSKDPHEELTPDQWTAEVAGDLEAGARWVITEGRESGTVGHLPCRRQRSRGPRGGRAQGWQPGHGALRSPAQGPTGVVHQGVRARGQPGQHRPGRRVGAGDAAARAAGRHL